MLQAYCWRTIRLEVCHEVDIKLTEKIVKSVVSVEIVSIVPYVLVCDLLALVCVRLLLINCRYRSVIKIKVAAGTEPLHLSRLGKLQLTKYIGDVVN